MEIVFGSKEMGDVCNSFATLQHRYGKVMAKAIMRRLQQLVAAETLHVMRTAPGKCHELTGDLAEHFALSLTANYRLIIAPDHDPAPRKPDKGLDWQHITRVRIITVREDYHG